MFADISGPFITTDKNFPLHAGSVVELTCKAFSRGHILELYMNCLDTDVQTDRSNNNTYVAKLSKRVKSSDNGTLCACKLSSVITSSSSIKLHIISKYMFQIDTLCGASLPAQRQYNFIWYFYMFFILHVFKRSKSLLSTVPR